MLARDCCYGVIFDKIKGAIFLFKARVKRKRMTPLNVMTQPMGRLCVSKFVLTGLKDRSRNSEKRNRTPGVHLFPGNVLDWG